MRAETITPRPARAAPRSPGERLRSAVLLLTGGLGVVRTHGESGWASITFSGTRHRLELVFDGAEAVEAGERFIAELPEHEFALPGQLVADATVVEADHRLDPPLLRVVCDVLVLEEG